MSPTLVMVGFPLFQKPSYLTAQCYHSLTIVYKHNPIQDKFYTHHTHFTDVHLNVPQAIRTVFTVDYLKFYTVLTIIKCSTEERLKESLSPIRQHVSVVKHCIMHLTLTGTDSMVQRLECWTKFWEIRIQILMLL